MNRSKKISICFFISLFFAFVVSQTSRGTAKLEDIKGKTIGIEKRLPSYMSLIIPITVKISHHYEFDQQVCGRSCQKVVVDYYVEGRGEFRASEKLDSFELNAPGASMSDLDKQKLHINNASGQYYDFVDESSCEFGKLLKFSASEARFGLGAANSKHFCLQIQYPHPNFSSSNIYYAVPMVAFFKSSDAYDNNPLPENSIHEETHLSFILTAARMKEALLERGEFQKTISWTVTEPEVENMATKNRLGLTIVFEGEWKLEVTPNEGLSAYSSNVIEKFEPLFKTYILASTGELPLKFAAASSVSWLDLSQIGGVLIPKKEQQVKLAFNEEARQLKAGEYEGEVSFANLNNGEGGTKRPVTLEIGEEQLWRVNVTGWMGMTFP